MGAELIAAVKRGDSIAIRSALANAPEIDGVDSQGWTALFHAAERGDTAAIRLLIESGADVNHGSETGFTALFAAVLGQHTEAVRALLESGARVLPTYNGGQLRALANKPEIIQMLAAAST